MTAVNRGSKKNVTMLLARGASIDCDWSGGMSLVADAMNYGDIELIMMLMDHGARVTPTAEMLANGQDQKGFYLLHYAVDDGLYDIAKLLIEKGKIPLNTLDGSGWSPLHLAAGHNNLDMVSLLIEKGADVNVQDSNRNTPLAWAREMKATDVISELTKYGGKADKEWYGEKLEMKTYEQRAEEWAASEHNQDGEYQQEQEDDDADSGRFEIEVEDTKPKRPTTLNGKDTTDALQRQRPTANTAIY